VPSARKLIGTAAFSLAVCFFAGVGVAEDGGSKGLLIAADDLFARGYYESCITEYQRFLFFSPDHPLGSYARYKIGFAHYKLGRLSEAIRWWRRALDFAPPTHFRQIIRYRLAFALAAHGEMELAKVELLRLKGEHTDPALADAASLALTAILVSQGLYTQARETLETVEKNPGPLEDCRASLSEACNILTQLGEPRRAKSPGLARALSTVVPGLGQLYAGDARAAANAFFLNAVTTYALVQAANRGNMLDCVLLGSSFWFRYYQGNRFHAGEIARAAARRAQAPLEQHFFHLLRELERCLPDKQVTISWEEVSQMEHAAP